MLKFTAELVLHISGIWFVIVDGTNISTVIVFVCCEEQVLVPITYWITLLPMEQSDGFNTPFKLI